MNYYNKTANGYIEHLEKNNFAMLNWIAYLYLSFSILADMYSRAKIL